MIIQLFVLLWFFALGPHWLLADDDVEDAAITAHRAKAAAVRKAEQAKAEKAERLGKAGNQGLGRIVEQVMRQFQFVVRPPPFLDIPADVRIDLQGDADGNDFIIVEPGGAMGFGAPAIAAPHQIDADGLNPTERQMLQQVIVPLLDRELKFARQASGLDEAQFKSLSETANTAVKDVAREYVKLQHKPRKVVVIKGIRRIAPPQVRPQTLVENCLATSIAKIKLSKDQAAAYEQEVVRRAEFQKRAGAEAFVAAIDERLILDDQQREKLNEAILKNWDDAWTAYLPAMLYSNNFTPPVPNDVLLPVLRQDQKKVWQAQNSNGGNIFHLGF
ncbi:MAG: hypothetical protein IT427_03700 [Pirellulales bacterium]|nr:hypothetical protein [Pirellulales bacterium]